MYTIVTAFFNINRESWQWYRRSVDTYLKNAQRLLTLDDYMVIYVEPAFVNFVKEHRRARSAKTKIISMPIEQLPHYPLKQQIEDVMNDSNFKEGLVDPTCPEVREPLYDVIMWSKVPLVLKTIEENPFKTSHFVWLDFGIQPHKLHDNMLNKPLLSYVPDKIKLLCSSFPCMEDLQIEKFYKSHVNRFVATMITGNADKFRIFNQYLNEEIQNCFIKSVVDSDQSLFTVIFLKHPELFELYYGRSGQLISNYYNVTENLAFVVHMALICRDQGNIEAYQEVMHSIKNYSLEMWKSP